VDTLSYKTISANAATANKEWLIIDAKNEVLGRLASKVAYILRGKHKTNFTPHADCGDNIIIINAEKVRLTGNKRSQKLYFTHTGYPGGQKRTTPDQLFAKRPESVIEGAVKGMLPRNRLGRAIYKNLYVYAGETHKHEAQQPKAVNLNDILDHGSN
jgi:large subunit ribosomal protein L13